MQIKFLGVPGERHQSISCYGIEFPLYKPVVVSDPKAIRKLSNHPHFEVVDDIEEAVLVDIKANSDGTHAAGPHPMTTQSPQQKESALEARAVAAGVRVDGRWSEARLMAEIENAEAGRSK